MFKCSDSAHFPPLDFSRLMEIKDLKQTNKYKFWSLWVGVKDIPMSLWVYQKYIVSIVRYCTAH